MLNRILNTYNGQMNKIVEWQEKFILGINFMTYWLCGIWLWS